MATSKEIIQLLETNGWVHVRTKGSHWVFKKEGESIPVQHPRKDVPKGTLNSILKRAGLK
ncbi:MAG: type II toxin-antitoxin system HicA family toxin [Fusobacteriales bacterium]|jgi:predicted RNA binding protein YcfA (HicA-like mRNA interferase family)|nr:type II toxin-antitoxin system HicA family toxin [Fusobacteriales bacterium]